MGSSSSESGDSTTTIRYADYVESAHSKFLSRESSRVDRAIGQNPYDSYSNTNNNYGYLGVGYSIQDFPSVYDIYGKFMAGLNIESIWAEIFSDTVNNTQVAAVVTAESKLMRDDLYSITLPAYEVGMRDIGAVNTSSFIIGKALLEDSRQKSLAKFSAELRYKLLPLVEQRYEAHLGWNQAVATTYIGLLKDYYTVVKSYKEMDFDMQDKRMRWPLAMLDYERAALGALQGATKTTSESGSSGSGAVLGGAMSGAAMGGAVSGGNPIGIGIGAVVGGVAGLLF